MNVKVAICVVTTPVLTLWGAISAVVMQDMCQMTMIVLVSRKHL